jgi:7,8-dihydro-6-hydroxymethylpterin-pyrophosphokinase
LPVYRNNEGLEQVALEAINQMREMRAFHESNGENAYRTPTMDCSWDCGFFNACLAMNDDGDPFPVLRTIPTREYEKDKVLEETITWKRKEQNGE